MNDISPKLQATLDEIQSVAELLSESGQDRVAEAIHRALLAEWPPADRVKALLDPANADVENDRVSPWDDVRARLQSRLAKVGH